eukprot:gb/GFBE01031264.1/.p1 GENE.gb/GFBE01031264.1/~~gb/GFBE01031264.1/.p1  ORF type:complete len:248 (+),score=43.00 gb/GFBE01031264.1/:1-744(+)
MGVLSAWSATLIALLAIWLHAVPAHGQFIVSESETKTQPKRDSRKAPAQNSAPRQVAKLNRVLFAGNTLQPMGGGAEQWIVAFCPLWWEPCKKLQPILAEAAESWQRRLNKGDGSSKIRFAQVDCAIDKVLCNEQKVDDYPSVAHYREGRQIRIAGLRADKLTFNLDRFLKDQVLREEPRVVRGQLLAECWAAFVQLCGRLSRHIFDLFMLAAFGASVRILVSSKGNAVIAATWRPRLWSPRSVIEI